VPLRQREEVQEMLRGGQFVGWAAKPDVLDAAQRNAGLPAEAAKSGRQPAASPFKVLVFHRGLASSQGAISEAHCAEWLHGAQLDHSNAMV